MDLESFRTRDKDMIAKVLEGDRPWGAYALGDLSDLHFASTRFYVNGPNLVMVYEGFQPPALYLFGGIGAMRFICEMLPKGDYVASFLAEPEQIFRAGSNVVQLKRMLRMKLDLTGKSFDGGVAQELSQQDLEAIAALMVHYPENAFSKDQLAYPTAGIYLDGQLVACAGTHVINNEERVACIGNVVVHPDFRGRGFAQQVMGWVLGQLKDQVDLVALNVEVKKKEAQELYQRMGFTVHCRFNEAEITLP